ncbi:MAG TPA: response regulator [Thermoanaerobaculia bacterium]|nr:response regulator [Thermoanaerobaculia bacterium]
MDTRVLIVDDCPVSRLIAQEELRGLGFSTAEVANGTAALTALERQSCDAVLMDCQMPGLDGYETTRRLRQRELGTGRRTVVIGFTASSGPEVEAHCREAGMDGLLTKPLNPQALTALLARARSAAPGRPGLRTGADLAGQVMESFLARGRRWLADLPR